MGKKKYKINGVDFELKEKYTLKAWGEILEILEGSKADNEMGVTINLINDGNLEKLVSLITGEEITELYDVDLPEINRLIMDFFSRKEGLTNVSETSSDVSLQN